MDNEPGVARHGLEAEVCDTGITHSVVAAGFFSPELPHPGCDPYTEADADRLIRVEVSFVVGINHVNRSVGLSDNNPFVLSDSAQRKLVFAHKWLRSGVQGLWVKAPLWARCRQEHLWPGRFHEPFHISTRQYARLVRDWVTSIGLEPSACDTHSVRRTKVAQIYRKAGNLRAVKLLLGHTKMDSTVRSLGVKLEDALAIAEAAEI